MVSGARELLSSLKLPGDTKYDIKGLKNSRQSAIILLPHTMSERRVLLMFDCTLPGRSNQTGVSAA
jgi:hypothetical protein